VVVLDCQGIRDDNFDAGRLEFESPECDFD
jgi:hypothetical protein